MQATLALDDELVSRLKRMTGEQDTAVLVNQALQGMLRRRELAEQLIALGGSAPDMAEIPRRRSDPA